ncbi:hypothetical protein [Phocaeicola vulgatus]
MRTENYYYVDKTMYLPRIEDTASYTSSGNKNIIFVFESLKIQR